MILSVALSLIASLAVLWLALVVVLLVAKPETTTLADIVWIVPDVARLIRRLATDKTVHGGVRARLWFLAVYLALPIDLIPDFIPVLGFADDAILAIVVLRSVVKRAGVEPIQRHWSGTPEGLSALARLCRLPELDPISSPSPPEVAGTRTDRAATSVNPPRSNRLLRAGFVLEGITLSWNVVGIIVLALAALAARSVALAGFGLDSFIEIGASTVVIWELSGSGHHRQRRALRIIGTAFVLLAIYLAVQSTYVLAARAHPEPSRLGIIWTAITAAVMFSLAVGKTRVGRALDNPVLRTEGRVTMVDALLAGAVLLGLVLNANLGWWWADPLAGYVILIYGLKEGITALRQA
jgi:uncharacterized membrane protein YkvA (DUF1232 family)